MNLSGERQADRAVLGDDDLLRHLILTQNLYLELIAGMWDGVCRQRLGARTAGERQEKRDAGRC